MNKILFTISLIGIFCACKKQDIEPVPQKKSVEKEPSRLPVKVIYSDFSYHIPIVYQYTYYTNDLVKTISRNNPSSCMYDSTVYAYNSNNQVCNKKIYIADTLYEDTDITYTATKKVAHVKSDFKNRIFEYSYYYTSEDEVDYVLTHNGKTGDIVDSITIRSGETRSYAGMIAAGKPYDYMRWSSTYYFISFNGAYTWQHTTLDIDIDFQLEVAETFIKTGETSTPSRNYFQISLPRKYCKEEDGKTYTYTFDDHTRLTKIEGMIENQPLSKSQGRFTYDIYY